MQEEYKRVIRSILTAEDESTGDDLYSEWISAYVDAELSGKNAAILYPQLAEHLKTCLDCYEEYSDLRLILEMEEQEETERQTRPSQYDLSFLQEIEPPPSLWTNFRAGVRRLVTEVNARFGEKMLTLAELSEVLLPYRRFEPVQALRKVREVPGLSPEALNEVQVLPDYEQNTRLSLYMGAVHEDRGTVLVEVAEIEPGQQEVHARVALRDRDRSLLERASTVNGIATFRDLKAGEYLIEVERNSTSWELELNLRD